jgi:hypothetical protein
VSVLSQPNHPARLVGVAVAAFVLAAVMFAAALAGALVVDDMRGGSAPAETPLAPDIRVPEGFRVVVQLESADDVRAMAGFAPFVPERVPSTTDPVPHFAVTPEDEHGERIARVAFSAQPEGVDGITGPLIVLEQTDEFDAAALDTELKRLVASDARAVTAQFSCGDLAVTAAFYFQPAPLDGEPVITPYMTDIARSSLDAMQRQCAD